EFYIPARGWVPVEFLSWGYGKRVLSAINVVDDRLREELIADTELYDDYYFGNVDPFRIHTSEYTSKLQFLCLNGAPVNDATLQTVSSQIRHRLSCSFSWEKSDLPMPSYTGPHA